MTKTEINNITLAEALKIAKEQKMKMYFHTSEAEIKAFARQFLRSEKKQPLQTA